MEKDELTYAFIGYAMKVHNTLGPGFQEVKYQRCLVIELERAGIDYQREQEQVVFYDGIEVGTRRADFIVEDRVVLWFGWKMLIWLRRRIILWLTISRRACLSILVAKVLNTN